MVEEWLKFLQLAMGLLGVCGLLPRRCPCYGKPTLGWAPSLETEYGGEEEEETLDVESSRLGLRIRGIGINTPHLLVHGGVELISRDYRIK